MCTRTWAAAWPRPHLERVARPRGLVRRVGDEELLVGREVDEAHVLVRKAQDALEAGPAPRGHALPVHRGQVGALREGGRAAKRWWWGGEGGREGGGARHVVPVSMGRAMLCGAAAKQLGCWRNLVHHWMMVRAWSLQLPR